MTKETNNGRETIEVPLSNHTAPAKLFRHSLKILDEMGVSRRWFLNSNGRKEQYVKAVQQRRPVSVARLITGAGPRERVSFRNRNRLDLRLDNLKVIKCKTKEKKQK